MMMRRLPKILHVLFLLVGTSVFAADGDPSQLSTCVPLFRKSLDLKSLANKAYIQFLRQGLQKNMLTFESLEEVLRELENGIVINPFERLPIGGEKDGLKRGVTRLLNQSLLEVASLVAEVRALRSENQSLEVEKNKTREKTQRIFYPHLTETLRNGQHPVTRLLFRDQHGSFWRALATTDAAHTVIAQNLFDKTLQRELHIPEGTNRKLVVTSDGREIWFRSMKVNLPTDKRTLHQALSENNVLTDSYIQNYFTSSPFFEILNHHGDKVVMQVHSVAAFRSGGLPVNAIDLYNLTSSPISKVRLDMSGTENPHPIHLVRNQLGEKILIIRSAFQSSRVYHAYNVTLQKRPSQSFASEAYFQNKSGQLMRASYKYEQKTYKYKVDVSDFSTFESQSSLDAWSLANDVAVYKGFAYSTLGRVYAWGTEKNSVLLKLFDLQSPDKIHSLQVRPDDSELLQNILSIQIFHTDLGHKIAMVIIGGKESEKTMMLFDLDQSQKYHKIPFIADGNRAVFDGWPLHYARHADGRAALIYERSPTELDVYDMLLDPAQAEVTP